MRSRADVTSIQYENGKRTRTKFLAAVQEGKSLRDAALFAGWMNMQSYYYHRKHYPLWAAEVDLARQGNRPNPTMLVTGLGHGSYEVIPGPPTTERISSEFQEFVKDNFPDRRPHQKHQLQIVTELHGLRPREVCLFLIWPEAGKTSTIEDYICKTLAEDPNHRFRIFSEGQDLSKRIVGTCARRFTETNDYPHFQARYGPFYEKGQERQGKPWTTDQITVWKNSGMERDRSLVAQSWSGANYGSRIDTLIIDDVQSQRNYGQSEEIFRRIRGTFFNRGKEMRTLIVGTRIGPDDFYDRMMNAGLITRKVVLPAMRDDGTPYSPDADEAWKNSMVHDGGPCCSGFRVCPNDGSPLSPKEYLEQVRHQVGEESWWASYMQKPSSDQRTTFGALLDRCLDKDRPYGMLPAGVR